MIHYYLKNSSPEVLDILILDEKGKTVRRLNGMGESGINRLEWDLSPDGRPAAKGVYEQASPLVRPGIYRVEVRGKNILLTAEVRVKGPSQIKVGRAG